MDASSTSNSRSDVRIGMSAAAVQQDFLDNLHYLVARFPPVATPNDNYTALAYTVRDRLLARWVSTVQTYLRTAARTVCYFSAEYLLGPQLGAHLVNLGLRPQVEEAMAALGIDLDVLLDQEQEPGLGNGGLGRLAACYLESLSTLEIPAIGYGIRYEFGIFDQEIRDGWQVEVADKWLRLGYPWEVPRPEIEFDVMFGGRTEAYHDAAGRYRVRWLPDRVVKGVASDTPIPGYGVNSANFLRLWKAEAAESFDFQAFNVGDYYGAVDEKVFSENVTKVLYPNDDQAAGKALRLEQQYLLVSCSLQDMIRLFLQRELDLDEFDRKFAVQLNDTHPALAIPELMRLLVDVHGLGWEPAWDITRRTFAYTNHTLLPEALEQWPVRLLGSMLPRHLEIIYEINERFLGDVRARFPGDEGLAARLSLINEAGERSVRMAHLAAAGSHAVNGVAELHTELLRRDVLGDFHAIDPHLILNVTNGVTQRRFLLLANPRLAALITEAIGDGWVRHLDELRRLEPLADDGAFQERWRDAKAANKRDLALRIRDRTGVAIDPDAMLDVQVKRIHEYKRQHLNLLHVLTLYDRLKQDPGIAEPPRTVLLAGKAAPGYAMSKLIIRLAHAVADLVNSDPALDHRLKVVFFPDYNVKNAQPILAAAELSEQISTAGKEASGTGNMKLAMNGALTIGTLDGANIEIMAEVGEENFFRFGMDAAEVRALRSRGYRPRDLYEADEELRTAIEAIAAGSAGGDARLFRPLVDALLDRDEYFVLADYPAYAARQRDVGAAYLDRERWTRMSILNVARMGRFSSDRAIREYAETIWQVEPVRIEG